MKTLFLDVASHSGFLVLIQDDHVLVMKEIDHRISDADLVPLFEAAMEEASWKPEDITHLACVVGPGGFTSLRIGVAFVNTLAWALKVPVAGVHLSDLSAARTKFPVGEGYPSPTGNFLWLHSTKKNEIFVRGFGDFSKNFHDAHSENLDELFPKLKSGSSWTGELIPEHQALIEHRGLSMLLLRAVDDILPAFTKNLTFGRALLVPWYGRPSSLVIGRS